MRKEPSPQQYPFETITLDEGVPEDGPPHGGRQARYHHGYPCHTGQLSALQSDMTKGD